MGRRQERGDGDGRAGSHAEGGTSHAVAGGGPQRWVPACGVPPAEWLQDQGLPAEAPATCSVSLWGHLGACPGIAPRLSPSLSVSWDPGWPPDEPLHPLKGRNADTSRPRLPSCVLPTSDQVSFPASSLFLALITAPSPTSPTIHKARSVGSLPLVFLQKFVKTN